MMWIGAKIYLLPSHWKHLFAIPGGNTVFTPESQWTWLRSMLVRPVFGLYYISADDI